MFSLKDAQREYDFLWRQKTGDKTGDAMSRGMVRSGGNPMSDNYEKPSEDLWRTILFDTSWKIRKQFKFVFKLSGELIIR